jgi:hypothetical protein
LLAKRPVHPACLDARHNAFAALVTSNSSYRTQAYLEYAEPAGAAEGCEQRWMRQTDFASKLAAAGDRAQLQI